jgi:hypothetical protein
MGGRIVKGHEQLIEMRQRGRNPSAVFVETDNDNRLKPWRDWHVVNPDAPVLWIEPEDSPLRLDLRCVIGLPVLHVDGCDEKRIKAVANACLMAGAVRAISSLCDFNRYGEKTLLRLTDSSGKVNWERPKETANG